MKTLLEPPIPTEITAKLRRRIPVSRPRRFNRILVPIDFSRPSLKAIPYALAISRQFDANAYLLHVTDVAQQPPPSLLTLPVVPRTEWDQRLMRRLKALLLKYRTDGNVSALEPRTGVAYEEICAAAAELKADLTVLATHGYTGYKRILLGSTAERVVQHSTCPVLVVRLHARHWNGSNGQRTQTGFQLKKILVPTDFSDCSKAAFSYATELARDFRAELRLVHVIHPQSYPFGDQYLALDAASLTQEATESASRQMRRMAAKTGVRFSVQVRRGSPPVEICEAANQDADLIVTSTHGRTGIRHAFIGSTAEHLVRYARCPVLVIPAHGRFDKNENTIFNRAGA